MVNKEIIKHVNKFIKLHVDKELVENNFDWLKLSIKNEYIFGSGTLVLNGLKYQVELMYSENFKSRKDRIWIKNIAYNKAIHMYLDGTLCLYHPESDVSKYRGLPLYQILPWISEWCIHYEEWKKYGVWLGDEYEH